MLAIKQDQIVVKITKETTHNRSKWKKMIHLPNAQILRQSIVIVACTVVVCVVVIVVSLAKCRICQDKELAY